MRPNALVDLFQGEQQKNVDFAFLQALKTTRVDPQQGVMLIYDIVCQYIIYILDYIGTHLPASLSSDAGHWAFACFIATRMNAFFTMPCLSFQGLGIVVREILKSLSYHWIRPPHSQNQWCCHIGRKCLMFMLADCKSQENAWHDSHTVLKISRSPWDLQHLLSKQPWPPNSSIQANRQLNNRRIKWLQQNC